MKHTLITRDAAHSQNSKRFYTGRPCKFGHDAQRFVSTGGCVECNAGRSKKFTFDQNRTAGKFIYPLAHPDDHAAAWAYCQALDLDRGALPTPRPSPEVTPELDIAAMRAHIFKGAVLPEPQSNVMHPDMLAQIRSYGHAK